MPEAASLRSGRPADEAAALRKTLARNEPWMGLQGKPVEPITVHAMSMATAWNLRDGSQMTWFNNGLNGRVKTGQYVQSGHTGRFWVSTEARAAVVRVRGSAGSAGPRVRGRLPGADDVHAGKAVKMVVNAPHPAVFCLIY